MDHRRYKGEKGETNLSHWVAHMKPKVAHMKPKLVEGLDKLPIQDIATHVANSGFTNPKP